MPNVATQARATRRKYEEYRDGGGDRTYAQWLKWVESFGLLDPTTGEYIGGRKDRGTEDEVKRLVEEVATGTTDDDEFKPWWEGGVPPKPREAPPSGFRWTFDAGRGIWTPERVPYKETVSEEAQQREQEAWEREQYERKYAEEKRTEFARIKTEQERWGAEQEFQEQKYAEAKRLEFAETAFEREQWQAQQAYQQQQFEEAKRMEYANIQREQEQWQAQQAYQQQQFGLQEQQFAWEQEETQRRHEAQLMAQPASWLQYASYTGQEPVVQPWMQPLMPQQYGMGAGAQQTGQPIPGWTPQSGAGMPELTRPSRQYQARVGPTAMAQYGGYRQARTGIRPEEEQWRLWSQAPPGGSHAGLRRTR